MAPTPPRSSPGAPLVKMGSDAQAINKHSIDDNRPVTRSRTAAAKGFQSSLVNSVPARRGSMAPPDRPARTKRTSSLTDKPSQPTKKRRSSPPTTARAKSIKQLFKGPSRQREWAKIEHEMMGKLLNLDRRHSNIVVPIRSVRSKKSSSLETAALPPLPPLYIKPINDATSAEIFVASETPLPSVSDSDLDNSETLTLKRSPSSSDLPLLTTVPSIDASTEKTFTASDISLPSIIDDNMDRPKTPTLSYIMYPSSDDTYPASAMKTDDEKRDVSLYRRDHRKVISKTLGYALPQELSASDTGLVPSTRRPGSPTFHNEADAKDQEALLHRIFTRSSSV